MGPHDDASAERAEAHEQQDPLDLDGGVERERCDQREAGKCRDDERERDDPL